MAAPALTLRVRCISELQSGRYLMLKVRSLPKDKHLAKSLFKMINHNKHGIIILQKSADGDRQMSSAVNLREDDVTHFTSVCV